MTIPYALTAPAALTEQRLRSTLAAYRADWPAIDPLLDEIVDRLEALVMAGGKRVRPAMAYWGFVGAGGSPDDPGLADLAAALELLQGFALFHDDVMDGSVTRRGNPTAHVVEIERHRAGGWQGEARRYGEGVAILAGDVSLVLSDVLLHDAPATVRHYWNLLRIEVNLGQFLDVVGSARGDVPLPTAERIVDYKTARYTIVRPLQMGAALAGADELADQLFDVGRPLGVAFQLRDDLLGAFGDSAVTGKPVGDDLREGKPTALVAIAREAATPEQAQILAGIGTELSEVEVEQLQSTLHETGAVAEVQSRIDALTQEGLTALQQLDLQADAATHLTELANFLAHRES